MMFSSENAEKDLHLVCSGNIKLVSDLIDEALNNKYNSFFIKILCEGKIFLIGYRNLENKIDYIFSWSESDFGGFTALERIIRNNKEEILDCLSKYLLRNTFIILSFMTDEKSLEYSLKNSKLLENRLCPRNFMEYELNSIKKCTIQENAISTICSIIFSIIFILMAVLFIMCAFIHSEIKFDYILGGCIFIVLGIILLVMYFFFKSRTIVFCNKKIIQNNFSKKNIIYDITDISKVVNYFTNGRLVKSYIYLKNNKKIKCYIVLARGNAYSPHLDIQTNILETIRFINCLVTINNGMIENTNASSLINYS